MNTIKRLSASTLILSAFYSPFVLSQLEEVMVTAQKRAESLQDVSVSVSVVSGEKLSDLGIGRIEELTAYIPNLTMSETGIGTQMFIRGIGSGINQGFEQSVGTYVDGIYYGRAQLSRSPFFDMERIEVLRGPQVTLFGNNSIGGALSMTTMKPSDEFEGSLSALYSPQNGETEYIGTVSGSLTDNLRARLAYRKFDFDGYVDNKTLGRDEPERDFDTGRLILDFDPTDSIALSLKGERSTFNVEGRQIGILGGRRNTFGKGSSTTGFSFAGGAVPSPTANMNLEEIYNNQDFFPNTDDLAPDGKSLAFSPKGEKRYSNGDTSDNTSNNITLTGSFMLPNAYELVATVGYVDYDYDENCDCDFSGLVLFNYDTSEDYDQQSLELRFTSPGGDLFDFIGGVYFQQDNLDYKDNLITPEDGSNLQAVVEGITSVAPFAPDLASINIPRTFDQDNEQQAAFGQVTWNVSDSFRFIFGARVTHYKKKATRDMTFTNADGSSLDNTPGSSAAPGGQSQQESLDFLIGSVFNAFRHSEQGKRDQTKPSYNFITEWDVNDDILLFASVTSGFKAGGFDVRSNSPTSPDNQAQPNGLDSPRPGTFEFDDEEILAYEIGTKTLLTENIELNFSYFYTEIKDLQVSNFDGSVGFNVSNAGEATTQGIEMELRAALTEHLMLSASIGTLDFEFTDYKDGPCVSSDELILINNLDQPLQRNCTFDPATRSYTSDMDGETNIYVADYQGVVSLAYRRDFLDAVLFNGSIDYSFSDDFHANESLDKNMVQPAYGKFNIRVAFSDLDENLTVALLVRNATDETTIGFANNVPLASSQFAAPTYYAFYNEERSYAVQLKYNF